MTSLPNPLEVRERENSVNEIFLKRWSARAMSGEKVPADKLATVFEAARWAPSSYNEQEWRYLYAEKGTEHWDTFFGLLVEGNQSWCQSASHLIAVIARNTFVRNGNPNGVAILDTGASMQNLLLQATELGLVAHPMGGFDWDNGPKVLEVPEGFTLTAMIALGMPGDPQDLPEGLAKEETPTSRKPIEKIVMEGKFGFSE